KRSVVRVPSARVRGQIPSQAPQLGSRIAETRPHAVSWGTGTAPPPRVSAIAPTSAAVTSRQRRGPRRGADGTAAREFDGERLSRVAALWFTVNPFPRRP